MEGCQTSCVPAIIFFFQTFKILLRSRVDMGTSSLHAVKERLCE